MSPSRSILCIPGHRADWIEKARATNLYGADQLLLDLEDSVPAARKEEAREVVGRFIQHGEAVRVNSFSSEHFDRDMDMLEFFEGTIWVPKVESIAPISLTYERRSAERGRERLVACIESPMGILRGLPDTITCPSLTSGLAFGKHDYIASVGLSPWQTGAINHAAAQVALAAAARGVPCWMAPSYSPWLDDVSKDAECARLLGYTGMGCIAPRQVAIINATFSPDGDDRDRAKRLLAAAEANPGEAVFRTPGGDLVSPPTVAWARRVLGC